MSPSSLCQILILPLAFAALPLAAQIHEAEPPVDLKRGLVLSQDMKHGVEGFSAPTALKSNVGQGTFAISLFMSFPVELKEAAIASQWHDEQGWRFLVTADGALRFEGRTAGRKEPILVSTAPGVIAPETQHHLVINVLRDATKPNAGIWVDGIECASGVVPPVGLNPLQQFLKEPELLSMHLSSSYLRLYHRELSRPEILALQIEATTLESAAPKHPAPPADGPRFIPEADETIALIGGTEAVALAESGELEAYLLLAFPQTPFHFRNLAWEGDTVFHQDRPLNFGDLSQQLKRVNAGSVFVMFGRQECLDRGKEGLEQFKVAFGKLLDLVQKQTPNIVVVGPPPFEKMPPPLPDLVRGNAVLAEYNQAMWDEAAARKVPYCDILVSTDEEGDSGWTRDGVQLHADGAGLVARMCRRSLSALRPGSAPDLQKTDERILTTLRSKNRLWHDYWRPTNWAFLHGDRTQQPSSRDAVNAQLRFFPSEQEKYLPLIKDAEEKVSKLVEEVTKKLP